LSALGGKATWALSCVREDDIQNWLFSEKISGVSQTYLLTGDWKKASALYSGPYVVNVNNATTFTRL
jgi:hypothetical protein